MGMEGAENSGLRDSQNTGMLARNIAQNQTVFTGRIVVEPLAQPGRIVVPLSFRAFTEGYLISITNEPTVALGTPAVVLYQVNSLEPASEAELLGGDFLMPEGNIQIPVPGWLDQVTIDGVGFAVDDFTARTQVIFHVAVARMDRMVRAEYLGKQSNAPTAQPPR